MMLVRSSRAPTLVFVESIVPMRELAVFPVRALDSSSKLSRVDRSMVMRLLPPELTTRSSVLRQKLAPRQCCEYCITAYAAERRMYSSTTVASYVPSLATRRSRSAPRVWSK